MTFKECHSEPQSGEESLFYPGVFSQEGRFFAPFGHSEWHETKNSPLGRRAVCVDLRACVSAHAFVTAPSSKRRDPTFPIGSRLRTTGTRQREWVIHIGRNSTTGVKWVNGFGHVYAKRVPIWVIQRWLLCFCWGGSIILSTKSYTEQFCKLLDGYLI